MCDKFAPDPRSYEEGELASDCDSRESAASYLNSSMDDEAKCGAADKSSSSDESMTMTPPGGHPVRGIFQSNGAIEPKFDLVCCGDCQRHVIKSGEFASAYCDECSVREALRAESSTDVSSALFPPPSDASGASGGGMNNDYDIPLPTISYISQLRDLARK